MKARTAFLAALLALTALRLIVAAMTPLSGDEAYYWIWSRALAGGYLDHPPMVALWIRAGTLIAGETALGVRLLAPLSVFAGSLLLWRAGEDLLPGRNAGLWAAALLNATLAFGIGAVTMTPDTPLLFFWVATLWALGRLLASGAPGWWLAAGLCAGLAMASKYTAVFLPAGIFLWLLAVPRLRSWLRTPWPWLAALIAAAAFAPVLMWNAAHGWASLLKQGGRTGAWHPARAVQFLGELIGSQAGLATPLVFALCMGGIWLALRRAARERDPALTLLAALTALPVAVFLQHALGDRVQGNWPAIIYPAAAIAAAALPPAWLRLRPAALWVGGVMTALVYLQGATALLPLPARLDPTLLRLAGWGAMARQVDRVRAAQGARFVAADGYDIAAELAWHLPSAAPVIAVSPRWRYFRLPDGHAVTDGQPGLFVRSARRGDDIDRTPWASMAELGRIERGRDGLAAEGFRLFRVIGRPGGTAQAELPRRAMSEETRR